MSYILEALRKAERERQLAEAPSMPEILTVQPDRRRNWLPWLAASLLLAANCALLWHLWFNGKENAKPAELAPVPEKPAKPAQKLPAKAESQPQITAPVKTQVLDAVIARIAPKGKILIVDSEFTADTARAACNLERISLQEACTLNTLDLAQYKKIIVSTTALEAIIARVNGGKN